MISLLVHLPSLTLTTYQPISFLIKCQLSSSYPKCVSKSFRDYSKADSEGMNDFLLDWDFSLCLASSDVEVIWSHIKTAINAAIDKFVPLSVVSSRYSHLPKWFDGRLHHKAPHTLGNVLPATFVVTLML